MFNNRLRVCKHRSTTKEWLLPDNRSAQRNGAQPVMIGSFSGMVVHHVGYQSSSENRKLIPERVLRLSLGAEIVCQNRFRKWSVSRITLPISNFVIASNFVRDNTGVNRTEPSSPAPAFKTPSGTVTSTRAVSNLRDSLTPWAESSTWPCVHRT